MFAGLNKGQTEVPGPRSLLENLWMKPEEGNGSQELQGFVIFFIDPSNPEQGKKPWKDMSEDQDYPLLPTGSCSPG